MKHERNNTELVIIKQNNLSLPKEYDEEIKNILITNPKNENQANLSTVKLKKKTKKTLLVDKQNTDNIIVSKKTDIYTSIFDSIKF